MDGPPTLALRNPAALPGGSGRRTRNPVRKPLRRPVPRVHRLATRQTMGRTARPGMDLTWLAHYPQADLNPDNVLASFPDDEPLRACASAAPACNADALRPLTAPACFA